MPLKRGLERGSCDFCFRRKIKCDRSSRVAAGRLACSQCDLRETPCTFESDDVRVQRRRKNTDVSRRVSTSTPVETEARQQIGHSLVDGDEWAQTRDPASGLSNDLLYYPFADSTAGSDSSLDIGVATGSQCPTTTSSLPIWPDIEFGLSPGSASFLDSIFLQSHDMTEPVPNLGDIMPTQLLQPVNEEQDSVALTKNPYSSLDIQPETLDVAIDAYFSFASLALPILSKDDFMADYKDHRGSPALVFAVACQGCPFIQAPERWSLQQRLASRFREAFLQARCTAPENVVRLDDLEALALMVDFEYENSGDLDSPLQSQLHNLLLTHDSLVAMMLQYRIETRPAAKAATGTATVLSGATQRQTHLFWYVYGCDAFFSLDRKVASRIQDEDVDLPRQSHEVGNHGYFEAILSLAVIARRMGRMLCGPVARRKGVKCQDVENVYKQLEEWRANTCPHALQIPNPSHVASSRRESVVAADTGIDQLLPLHGVIVTLLELNCVMQLEDCVSRYGIEDRGSLTGQIADMRVKYETLRAAHKIVEVAKWIEELTAGRGTSAPASAITPFVADLAPGVIRNICAGASNWISLRAAEVFCPVHVREMSNPAAAGPVDHILGDGDIAGLSKGRARGWVESLATLRDVAATATSHRDTGRLVSRLDRQLEHLKDIVSADEERGRV
ncbi:hypothetical protein F5Y14DRAFT_202629 [Nemania sp. NC0429]|nr:hypothetical protein F5Y14DRAFT_202629 [Nemania sp. NC0429]